MNILRVHIATDIRLHRIALFHQLAIFNHIISLIISYYIILIFFLHSSLIDVTHSKEQFKTQMPSAIVTVTDSWRNGCSSARKCIDWGLWLSSPAFWNESWNANGRIAIALTARTRRLFFWLACQTISDERRILINWVMSSRRPNGNTQTICKR